MEIAPVEVVTTDIITKITVDVVRVEIFKCATIYVSLTTDTGKQVKSQCLELLGDDYKNWSNDDNYLYTYAASKLGYTIQPQTDVVTDTVVVEPIVTDPVVEDPANTI
jgi:hypothetical protein